MTSAHDDPGEPLTELTTRLLPLALVGAISPTVFLATVVILTGRRPLTRACAFAAGVTTVAVLVAFVGLFFGKGAVKRDPELSAIVDVVAGVLLLVLAVLTAVRPARRDDTTGPPEPAGPAGAGARLGALFVAGLGLMAANFSSTMPLFVAAKDIAAGTVAAWEKALLTCVVLLVILLPALLPIVITVAFPRQATRLLGHLRTFLARWGKWIVVGVFGVLGLYLVLRGISGIG